MTPDQRAAVLEIINTAQDLTLATVRLDGWPQATTVSFVADGLKLYFGCDAHSQKADNLARDPRISATLNLPYVDWGEIRGLSLAGRVDPVTDGEEAGKVAALMLKKFPQVAESLHGTDMAETRLFRITPSFISRLDYRNGFGWKEEFAV